MGGYGSTRWNYHSKKTRVEECRKWHISGLKDFLTPGFWGTTRWMMDEQETGSISFHVLGSEKPTALQVSYTIGARSEKPETFNYPVSLTTTPLPWGGVRYWFICPLRGCGRRAGCLYLPPGGKYFGCRHCYKLTYESQQEGSSDSYFYRLYAGCLQDMYPGINRKDARAMMNGKETPHLTQLAYERYLREWQDYDPYEGYLTREQLLQESGLSEEDLSKLGQARLLVPDTNDGRYRPKLAGWGKKLAYLLKEGWEVEGIKRWSKERWRSKNPRGWLPV